MLPSRGTDGPAQALELARSRQSRRHLGTGFREETGGSLPFLLLQVTAHSSLFILGTKQRGLFFPSVTAGTSGVPSPRSRHLPRASQELMFPLRSPGPPIKYRLSWPSLPAPPFSLHWLPDLYFVSALGTRGPLSVSLSPCPWRQQRPACRRLQRTCQRHRGVKNVPLAGARGS